MPTSKLFGPNTLLQRNDTRFISSIVNDEVILMDIKTGNYIALKTAAHAIWDILVKPITVSALIAQILQEYDVAEEEATVDTIDFLKQLLDQGMINILTNKTNISPSVIFINP
jgi:hypothetical protein